jgi:tetratricopeptide (TPR) repeat protein
VSFWNKLTGKQKTLDQRIVEGDLRGALRIIMNQVKEKPEEPSLLLKLADLYVRLGEKGNALKVYLRVGEFYGNRCFFNKAVAAFKKALTLEPENQELLQKLAEFNEKVPKFMINSAFVQKVRASKVVDDQTMMLESEEEALLTALPLPTSEGESSSPLEQPAVRRPTVADGERPDLSEQEEPVWEMEDEEVARLIAEVQARDEIAGESREEEPPSALAPDSFWEQEIEFDLDATLNAMEESADAQRVEELPVEPEDEWLEEETDSPSQPSAPSNQVAEPMGEAQEAVFRKRSAKEESALEDSDDLAFNSFDDAIDTLFQAPREIETSHVTENRRHWPIFRTLPKDALMELIVALETRTFSQGQVICRQGEAGEEMFLVTEGKVQVLRKEDGRINRLATLESGDFFGEGALLTRSGRTASVLAIENTEVLVLDQVRFASLTRHFPAMRESIESIWDTRRAAFCKQA